MWDETRQGSRVAEQPWDAWPLARTPPLPHLLCWRRPPWSLWKAMAPHCAYSHCRVNSILFVKVCLAFTQENLFSEAWELWVARTGQGHAVAGSCPHRPSGPGCTTGRQGSRCGQRPFGCSGTLSDGPCGVSARTAPQTSLGPSSSLCAWALLLGHH